MVCWPISITITLWKVLWVFEQVAKTILFTISKRPTSPISTIVPTRRSPLNLVTNILDCNIIVSMFDLQSRNYIPFRTNTLEKIKKPLFSQLLPGFNPRLCHTKDLKKWYLIPPCLTLNIIRYVLRVKWKGVASSPTPQCSSYWKGSLLVTLDYGHQLYLLYCSSTTQKVWYVIKTNLPTNIF